jgi:hypothetical protein
MLNRCNFEGWTPTGSLSVYAMRFKHYKTGQIVHVLWTLRGKRPVSIDRSVAAQEKPGEVLVTDAMDNTAPAAGR